MGTRMYIVDEQIKNEEDGRTIKEIHTYLFKISEREELFELIAIACDNGNGLSIDGVGRMELTTDNFDRIKDNQLFSIDCNKRVKMELEDRFEKRDYVKLDCY